MKKLSLFIISTAIAFCSTAQSSKNPQEAIVSKDASMVFTPLRGIRSGGVRGCDNCNVSGRLALNLGLKNFTVDKQVDFKYDEKSNTLTIKYLITNLVGKIRPGGTMVKGPFGGLQSHGGLPTCSQYGFSCPPPPNRIGKTRYEIINELKENYLVVTFFGDLKVEKGFFSGE